MPRKVPLSLATSRRRRRNERRNRTIEEINHHLENERQRMCKLRQRKKLALVDISEFPPSHILRLSSDANTGRIQEKLPATYCSARPGILDNKPYGVGRMDEQCVFCTTKLFSGEVSNVSSSICSHKGKVSKRVHEMAEKKELLLKERIKSLTAYSLAIVDCTDTSSIAQLGIFIRGVDAELNVCEELLDIIPITTETTNGEDMFQCVNACVQRMGLVWQKVVSIATDGAKFLTESKTGLIASMRQKFKGAHINENFMAIHCFIYQEALYARSFSATQNVMTILVKCVNLLRAHGLNQSQFRNLFKQDNTNIMYCSEILWLKPLFDFRKYIYVFLEKKGAHIPELIDVDWTCDLAFVTDVITHLKALSNTLMVRNKLILYMNDEIEAFTQKLTLCQRQLNEQNFVLFPCLQTLSASQNVNVNKYVQELENLKKDFETRFVELCKIKSKLDLFAAPFTFDVYGAPKPLQMELIELQCNTRMKAAYRESTCLIEFYQGICMEKFPKLREFAAEIMTMFGSTYMCEKFFSLLKVNKSKLSKWPSDTEDLKNLMRLTTAQDISPNLEELLNNTAQEISPSVEEMTLKIEIE